MFRKSAIRKTLSLLFALCVVLSLAMPLQASAAASRSISELSAEIRSKYGFETTASESFSLENSLRTLDLFPARMIKEMTDGYRRRGITPTIVHNTITCAQLEVVSLGGELGSASLSNNRLTISLDYSIALAHELGHAIDWHIEYLTGSSPSAGLARFNNGISYGSQGTNYENSDTFVTDYAGTSAAEDFADLISHIIEYPEYMNRIMTEKSDTPISRKVNYILDLIVNNFSSVTGKESFKTLFPIKTYINGIAVEFDQPPVIENGRTLVPLRPIFEALGADVDWDQSTQTISAKRGNTTITLKIGSNILVKNGTNIQLDVPAVTVGGRTLVPLRAVAESLDAKVGWDSATRTITITG